MKKYVVFLCFLMVSHLNFAQSENPNYYSYAEDYIQSYKRLGDELFIQKKNDSLVKYYYSEAIKRADFLLQSEDYLYKDNALLNKQYLMYKLILLENGIDYWGLTYNMEPLNPIEHFNKFTTLKAAFDKNYEEIERYLTDLSINEGLIDAALAKQDVEETNQKIQNIEQTKLTIHIENYDENIYASNERIFQINASQKVIETKSIQVSNQLESIEKQVDGLILSSFTQAIGLPIDPQKLDLKKDLKSNIINVGTALLNDPEVKNALGDISSEMEELSNLYQKAEEIKKQYNDLKNIADDVDKIIKDPCLSNFLTIGKKIYAKLPDSSKINMNNIVKNAPSIHSLLSLVNDKKILAGLKSALVLDADFDSIIKKNLLEKKGAQFSSWMTIVLKKADSLKGTGEYLAQQLSNQASELVLKNLSADLLDEIKKISGKTTPDEINKWLKTVNWKDIPGIKIDDGKLTFISSQKIINFSSIVKKLDPSALAILPSKYETELNKLIKLKAQFGNAILADFGKFDIEKIINQSYKSATSDVLKNNLSKQIFDGTLAQLAADSKINLVDDMAAQYAGSIFAEENMKAATNSIPTVNPVSTEPASANTAGNSAGAQDAVMKTAVMAGVTYAAPMLGLAISLADKIGQMSQMRKELHELYKAEKELTVEKVHLYDLLKELQLNKKIAFLDGQIAYAREKLAGKLLDRNRTQIKNQLKNTSLVRIKIQNRLTLLYYLSENLRKEFNLVDKALIFRHDFSIYEKIKNDPDNIRLALDEDIKLFEWLYTNVESERSDIEALKSHWDNLYNLIKTTCNECQEDYAPAAQVLDTKPISLAKLVPSQWNKFLSTRDTIKKFTFYIPILPGQNIVPLYENMRVLDIRIGGKAINGNVILRDFSLRHPGICYKFHTDKFVKEVLFPKQQSNFMYGSPGDANSTVPLEEQWPMPFDRVKLSQTWKDQKGMGMNNLIEGYGIFTIWQLDLTINTDDITLTDILLRFAYTYNENKFNEGINYDMVLSSELGNKLDLKSNSFMGLGNINEIESKINDFILNSSLEQNNYLKKIEVTKDNYKKIE